MKHVLQYREATLVLLIGAMFLVLSFVSPMFATMNNVQTTMLSVSITGIVGIGVTIALVIGGLDLSVGGLVAISAAVLGKVFLATNIWYALMAGVGVALFFGCLNGLLITRFRLGAFIATLAIMGISRGVTLVATKGTPISMREMPVWLREIGSGKVMGVSYLIIIFFVLTITTHIFLKKSKVLRKAVYIGSNEVAAHFSGINVNRIKFGVYAFIGLLCGVAGVLSVARFSSASPNFGLGMEVQLIAAAVIGGATLNGGQGSIIGTSLALIFLGFVSSAIVLLGVSVYWQALISNVILLLAVLLDAFVLRRGDRKH
ncbi:ABC transporter permease [Nitratireductor kimnyeongensis]|uniref:ABC transporter permease n=1 Tax=Nitratireductor kimnyeongensis TaxID=430679 RepID=A0ABW0T907_9HYPH|nr:ABC transporter permease [Nitratireductor kimnyeongensis]QZZ36451.1 ABC transporter permease [Nitratireductor kimnyeongensis]